MALAAAPAAGNCAVYFDATGQLNFDPPGNNTPLVPGISAANVMAGGPAISHGAIAAAAIAAGPGSLQADAAINQTALQPLAPGITQNPVQGLAYFATSTTCTPASFTTVLQSQPAGVNAPPPSGTVVAQLTGNTRIDATYQLGYVDQGTYLCSGGWFGYILCEVWRVDATFNFLPSTFGSSGAGTYRLTINQVTMTSP
ncbi:MAG: hypothetical protein KGN77_01205 [Xanthomonadaceae bacterium]|nr:hypothetical protein [Xanthomonadaceae bacterium]MDE1963989.1 hypothetical protein [Xanthomonadaceae bacterium]